MLGAIGKQKFTKALVLSAAPALLMSHAPRAGQSRYSPLRLTRLALHVLAGFWPQPIQWIGIALGVLVHHGRPRVGIYGVVFWINESNFPVPLFGGVGVIFVLGMQGFILALVGEYLGRIQRDVEGRPLYTIDRELSGHPYGSDPVKVLSAQKRGELGFGEGVADFAVVLDQLLVRGRVQLLQR